MRGCWLLVGSHHGHHPKQVFFKTGRDQVSLVGNVPAALLWCNKVWEHRRFADEQISGALFIATTWNGDKAPVGLTERDFKFAL